MDTYSIEEHDGLISTPDNADTYISLRDDEESTTAVQLGVARRSRVQRVKDFIKSVTWKGWLKFSALLGLVVLFILSVTVLRPWVSQVLYRFLEWVKSLGYGGPFLLSLVYAIATPLMVPGLVLTLGAGIAFLDLPPVPILWGVISVSLGSTVGATISFIFGRLLLRSWVVALAEKYPKMKAVDVAMKQQAWKIVLLIRLTPIIPFNIVNYLFALTDVPLLTYTLFSWIGMLPGTVMYVYIGGSLKSFADIFNGNYKGTTASVVLFWVGLAATVLCAVLIGFYAKKAMSRIISEAEQSEVQLSDDVSDFEASSVSSEVE